MSPTFAWNGDLVALGCTIPSPPSPKSICQYRSLLPRSSATWSHTRRDPVQSLEISARSREHFIQTSCTLITNECGSLVDFICYDVHYPDQRSSTRRSLYRGLSWLCVTSSSLSSPSTNKRTWRRTFSEQTTELLLLYGAYWHWTAARFRRGTINQLALPQAWSILWRSRGVTAPAVAV